MKQRHLWGDFQLQQLSRLRARDVPARCSNSVVSCGVWFHRGFVVLWKIHMDQSLGHTFSWGNSYGPMVLKVLLKFPPTLALVHGWLFPMIEVHFGRMSARTSSQELPLWADFSFLRIRSCNCIVVKRTNRLKKPVTVMKIKFQGPWHLQLLCPQWFENNESWVGRFPMEPFFVTSLGSLVPFVAVSVFVGVSILSYFLLLTAAKRNWLLLNAIGCY